MRNTLIEITPQNETNALLTELKLSEQNETLNAEKSQPLAEETYKEVQAYKEFLTSDLKLWSFTHAGETRTARRSPVDAWTAYFSEYANLDPESNWSDLLERAHFLTQLWQFCAAKKITFPLVENLNA